MDDQKLSRTYEKPHVIDYGDLRELTAGCLGATGGDAYTAIHGGYAGTHLSNPLCNSAPSAP
jgi:hypothetical protein